MCFAKPETSALGDAGAGGLERPGAAGVSSPDAAAVVLRAVDAAPLAVFAYRDARGRPAAWPITPYRYGDRIAVTSTLAFMQKALHVRRDPRVALLVGGLHVLGRAEVRADPSGRDFVRRLLAQELVKYPPAADIVRVPLHRALFSWYFGRVWMTFAPEGARPAPGGDALTLVDLGPDGFPRIAPIEPVALGGPRIALRPAPGGLALEPCDGPALVLAHLEPTMRDLRQLRVRGEVRGAELVVAAREGSLDPPPARGALAELRLHLDYHRRGWRARRALRGWAA